FAFTGFLGYILGPILNTYLAVSNGGGSIVLFNEYHHTFESGVGITFLVVGTVFLGSGQPLDGNTTGFLTGDTTGGVGGNQ
ncbi:hypothetical protein O5165_25655, partial [Escherichia coli]|nr:hypothetical protein [Escherichia coli]